MLEGGVKRSLSTQSNKTTIVRSCHEKQLRALVACKELRLVRCADRKPHKPKLVSAR